MNTADLSMTEKLNKLFTDWKEQQEKEEDQSFSSYEKRAVCKTSFDPDGIINEKEYQSNPRGKKILFIAKEGNVGGNSDKNQVNKSNAVFWLRCIVNGDYSQTTFSNRLALLCNALHSEIFEKKDKNHDILKRAAFMNLNKRGGYRYCNWSVLERYTEKYSDFIKNEIEIIAPDIIVCCGKGVKYLLEKYVVNQLICSPRLVEVYHPSYFKISDKEYLRLSKIAINGMSSENYTLSTEIRSSAVHTESVSSDNVKGIIFDTDMAYEPGATDEMLSRVSDDPSAAVIMAFGSARKTLRYFNRGDYVYYYYKGIGIIAVGIVEDEPDSYEDVYERKVRLIVEPVKKNGEYIGVKADSELKGLATGKTGGFWLYGTTKKPYIYGKENNERAANEIRKKIAAAKN